MLSNNLEITLIKTTNRVATTIDFLRNCILMRNNLEIISKLSDDIKI